jgi:hypothetical protein
MLCSHNEVMAMEEYPPDMAALLKWLQAEVERIDTITGFDLSEEERKRYHQEACQSMEKMQRWLKVILAHGYQVAPGPFTIIEDVRGLPIVVERNTLH